MMAWTYIRITLLLPVFASMLACSYETRHVQFSLAVRPMNEEDAALMRAAVKDFSNARGFSTLTEAGVTDYLRATGSYLYSFKRTDNSYISVSNVVNTKCYDLGIHSDISAATAQALGEHLGQILRSTISAEVTAESTCNAD
jgi:hypothetical protein